MTFNPNTYEKYHSINFVKFERDSAGNIKHEFWSYATRDYYANPLDRFRAFLELIYIIYLCYYLYIMIKELMIEYHHVVRSSYKSYFASKKLKDQAEPSFSYYIGIKLDNNFKDLSIIVAIADFTIAIIMAFIKVCAWIIYTIIKYTTTDYINLLKVSTNIIALVLIAFWIKIFTQNEFIILEDGSSDGAYDSIYWKTYWTIQYSQLASVHILLNSLLLMTYFSFSAKLSTFYEVLKAALGDLVFFILLFFISCLYCKQNCLHILSVYDERNMFIYDVHEVCNVILCVCKFLEMNLC